MRFDGMNTLAGRHLVFAYAAVILIQGGYFLWIVSNWLKFDERKKNNEVARLTSLSEEPRN